MSEGVLIARAYQKGELCGWAGARDPELARQQVAGAIGRGVVRSRFQLIGQTRETKGKKALLYLACRKVLGQDTECPIQQVGDCVSQGSKQASEYLTCVQIALGGLRQKFRYIFAPYYYGTGRVYVGRGRLGHEDGSLGSWMAEAVQKYGTLFADEPNVPRYSGSVARAWGDPNPAPDLDKWRDIGSRYLVRSAALIRTWDELVAALANGYAVTTASNVGYSMEPSSDGFHRQTTNWAHQMFFQGACDDPSEPYALLRNSWGDVHGHLKDFDDGHDLPVGTLRIRRRDAEKHIRAGETFAYSQFDGFPEQDLDRALFDLIRS